MTKEKYTADSLAQMHAKVMALFHEYHAKNDLEVYVLMSGPELNDILVQAKKEVEADNKGRQASIAGERGREILLAASTQMKDAGISLPIIIVDDFIGISTQEALERLNIAAGSAGGLSVQVFQEALINNPQAQENPSPFILTARLLKEVEYKPVDGKGSYNSYKNKHVQRHAKRSKW